MLRIACLAALGVVACSHARAADKTMPINFIGEWCYSSQENKTTSYTLPSWKEDGHCTKILSIEQWGFYGEGRHCEPVNVRLTKDTAPSGTAYIATVTARCQPDDPVTRPSNSIATKATSRLPRRQAQSQPVKLGNRASIVSKRRPQMKLRSVKCQSSLRWMQKWPNCTLDTEA